MKTRKITKREKIYSFILLFILLFVGVLFVLGGNKRKAIEEVLNNYYNREFTVLKTYNRAQGQICAVVKMNDVNNHIFEMLIGEDKTGMCVMKSSEYVPYKIIAEKEIEEILKEDLKDFFPDFWVRAHYMSDIKPKGNIRDINMIKDEEVIDKFELAVDSARGCFVHVFINSECGSYRQYEKEYDYFTNTYGKYLQDRKVYPLCITFFWVSREQVKEIQKNVNESFDVNSYYSIIGGIRQKTACFIEDTKGYIGSIDEYISVREELEDE